MLRLIIVPNTPIQTAWWWRSLTTAVMVSCSMGQRDVFSLIVGPFQESRLRTWQRIHSDGAITSYMAMTILIGRPGRENSMRSSITWATFSIVAELGSNRFPVITSLGSRSKVLCSPLRQTAAWIRSPCSDWWIVTWSWPPLKLAFILDKILWKASPVPRALPFWECLRFYDFVEVICCTVLLL